MPELPPKQSEVLAGFGRLSRTIGGGGLRPQGKERGKATDGDHSLSLASAWDYAELQVTSHFSFLRGASSYEELFAHAALLGIPALGVADRNSLAGIVRAHEAAKVTG